MNIHKFNVKSKNRPVHKTIKWIIPTNNRSFVKKVHKDTWEIYSQENIILQPKEVKYLFFGIGFSKSEGVVLTSLSPSLTLIRCSLQNETNLQDTDNIITVITNNSKESVKIQKMDLLCLVSYKKL